MNEELIEIVNERGEVLGIAPRAVVHGNPALLHRVVHVLVMNSVGSILLQKRSMNKDVAPGRWDTSVGGHMEPGEDPLEAARREMQEELGIRGGQLEFLYSYVHSNPYESELVHTYRCIHEGPFSFNADEIDELRFWAVGQIRAAMGSGALSDNFEHEMRNYFRLV